MLQRVFEIDSKNSSNPNSTSVMKEANAKFLARKQKKQKFNEAKSYECIKWNRDSQLGVWMAIFVKIIMQSALCLSVLNPLTYFLGG